MTYSEPTLIFLDTSAFDKAKRSVRAIQTTNAFQLYGCKLLW